MCWLKEDGDYSCVLFSMMEGEIERIERGVVYFSWDSLHSVIASIVRKVKAKKMTEFASWETLRSPVFCAQVAVLWDSCDKKQCWTERHFPHSSGNWHSSAFLRTSGFGPFGRQQPGVNISFFLMVPSAKPTISMCLRLYKPGTWARGC